MKLYGFKPHSIYLDTEIEGFDLHNCFSFVGLDYDISLRTLRLRWTPSSYAPLGERRTITVIFQQVTHFSAEPRDPAIPFAEGRLLGEHLLCTARFSHGQLLRDPERTHHGLALRLFVYVRLLIQGSR